MARPPKESDPSFAEEPDLEALRAENAALREKQEAADALQSQMIDMLAELQEKVAALPQAAAPVVASSAAQQAQAEMDAELDALKAEFKDFEGIELAARRAELGVEASLDIRLKDEPDALDDPRGTNRKWFLYWANFGKENRSQDIKNKGFVKVRRDEVRDPESLGAMSTQDEFVRRGDRGQEVLHKQPMKVHLYLKRREQMVREGVLGSESRLRDYLANGTAGLAKRSGENADQAGSFVASQQFRVSLKDTPTERVTY